MMLSIRNLRQYRLISNFVDMFVEVGILMMMHDNYHHVMELNIEMNLENQEMEIW